MSSESRAGSIRMRQGLPSGAISPVKHRLRLEYNVLTPMRDGVCLAMDIIRPDVENPLPVVLVRTPYDKVEAACAPFLHDLARRGYLIAIQDCEDDTTLTVYSTLIARNMRMVSTPSSG